MEVVNMSNAGEKFNKILDSLEAEDKRKEDIMSPINSLRVSPDFTFESEDLGKIRMTEHAFGQLCQQVYNYNLPAEYFKNLFKESPERFAEQLNYHLINGKATERKFRTVRDEVGGQSEIRGIVSQSYIPYDNLDALRIFMDTARDLPNYDLKDVHMDDKMMFLRFIFPETEKNFGRSFDGQDDRNFIALDLINSEVGFTSIVANPSIYRLICTNGLVAKQAEYGFYKQRHMHVDPHKVNEDLRKSIVHGVETGKDILHKFEKARQITVENPYELITDYGKRKAMSEKMLRTVRTNYDIEADKSLFGIVNSFTRTARDIKSLERRLEIEKYASRIMDKELKARAV
ncbi:hypothetical protein CON39_11955 [Bacillus thuringiensis]|nr:hypothetical protein CON39_11955 [Bacillus thuringiensis]